jgi:hypothetical protein
MRELVIQAVIFDGATNDILIACQHICETMKRSDQNCDKQSLLWKDVKLIHRAINELNDNCVDLSMAIKQFREAD